MTYTGRKNDMIIVGGKWSRDMKKLVKSYTQYDFDGGSAERKFTQLDQGSIEVSLSWHSRLVPFAMDQEMKEFIIFMVERKEQPNLFIWVYLAGNYKGKTVRVTMVNELMQFTKWTGEPMDVSGSFPSEVISEAISKLQSWQEEEIKTDLLELNEWMNRGGNDPRWKADEKILLSDVRIARKENNGLMPMY